MLFLFPWKDFFPARQFSISSFHEIEKVSLSAGNFPSIHPSGRPPGGHHFFEILLNFFLFWNMEIMG
jgi:hypothetical protein